MRPGVQIERDEEYEDEDVEEEEEEEVTEMKKAVYEDEND